MDENKDKDIENDANKAVTRITKRTAIFIKSQRKK
jgi:hypothetical protein